MFDSNLNCDSDGVQQDTSNVCAQQPTDVDVSTRFCKICYETEAESDDWLHPCKCSGTIKWVHRKCLVYWLENAPSQQQIQCSMCKYYYVHVWHLKPFNRWTLPRLRLGFLDGLSIFLDVMTTYTCVKRIAELIQGKTKSVFRSLSYIVFWRLFMMTDRRVQFYRQLGGIMLSSILESVAKMKKFINSPENVVDEAIKGLTIVGNASILANCRRVVLRSDLSRFKELDQVTLISGGGSGHEPFGAGFVGKNALTGAVCGDVFASPPSSAITSAVNAISGDAGTIVFVLNYTGDRLNFGIAVEKIRSQSSKRVELIYVDDDVSFEHKENVATGGRGLAGVSLLIHIIGTFAEQYKMKFEELIMISRTIISNTATIGVNLESCALPGQGRMFVLAKDEYELGLGIHGEAGIERRKMESASVICNEMLERLVHCKRLKLMKNEPIAILLNNLGSVSQLEMGVLKSETISWLLSNGYDVQCLISGTLMTSIDARGFSLTILRIVDQRWLHCLLECESAVSLLWVASRLNKEPVFGQLLDDLLDESVDNLSHLNLCPTISSAHQTLLKNCLEDACNSLISMESELNKLDSSVGDGDCGTSMKMAAIAILKTMVEGALAFKHPKSLFLQLSKLIESSVGGTSGALYALMLNAAAGAFERPLSSEVIKNALGFALKSVEYYAGAKPGHRTLVDPLNAAANYPGENWNDISKAVDDQANATAKMEAKAGRASYTDKSQQTEPDPGAVAFATWFRAVNERYQSYKTCG
uniref:Triokinase/FMN cyclase n=1 Tax=Globodera rostochiensis TaxID=31243 RepID=A0A914HZV0_GLORO